MADANELRTQMGMERWSDKELAHMLGQKAFEHVDGLAEFVDTRDAFSMGIESLLRSDVNGETDRPTESPILAAMITEARNRIASRNPQGAEIG